MASRVTFSVSFDMPDKKAAVWVRETPSRWDILAEIHQAIKDYWDNNERLMAVEILRLNNDGGVRSTEDSGSSRQDGAEVKDRDNVGSVNGGS